MDMLCLGDVMGTAGHTSALVTQSLSLLLRPVPLEGHTSSPLSSETPGYWLAPLLKVSLLKDLSQQISAAETSAGREHRHYFRSYNALNFKQNIQCCGRDINLHASGHRNLPVTGD